MRFNIIPKRINIDFCPQFHFILPVLAVCASSELSEVETFFWFDKQYVFV